MSAQTAPNASGDLWKVSARPTELTHLASALDEFVEVLWQALSRNFLTKHVRAQPVADLRKSARELGINVRRTAQQVDAADLASRLHRYSSMIRRQVRSRSLLYPSKQARQLGLGDRTFLRVMTKGHGQVVEVVGDLATAKHIAVIVPGMTNKLGDYDPNTREKGIHLASAMRALDPQTAVVTWLGYRTPDLWSLDAAGSARARVGAAQLVDDLEVIRRMAPNAHLSVVSHSYGTIVAGETLKGMKLAKRLDQVGVTDVVALGSPGMNVDKRSQLGHPNIDVWASNAPWNKGHFKVNAVPFLLSFPLLGMKPPFLKDPIEVAPPHPVDVIPYAPLHGPSPADNGFGAKPFSTKGAVNHSTYFSNDTVSLENIARIATNKPVVS
jgi:Alpha/beta hydrolase